MKPLKSTVLAALLLAPMLAQAIVLVTTSDGGYYNDSIGTVLNGTNGGETGPFPVTDDLERAFPDEPDLSAASGALGDWLTDPFNLNANWSFLSDIPNSWTAGTEVAVIYQFNTLGATNVVADFGVDNGIFAWLDGQYLLGRRGPGSAVPGEYQISLGDLAEGTYFLQLLLEDHGSASGYHVEITADTFEPGPVVRPPDNQVPEPGALALAAVGLAGVGYSRKRRS